MKTTFSCLIGVMLILSVTACSNKKQIDDSKVLSDTDRSYSDLSAEKGMNTAFLAMFDSSAVMLNANKMPVEGFEAIKTTLMSESDSTFILTWEPKFARMAASCDLGYTWGVYQIKDKITDSITGVGKYATIWIKKSDGKWKAILDTGNPGLGEKK
jgi:ketosteroid isomerase-like protein